MEMQLQLSQRQRLEIRESCSASALPKTFEFVRQDIDSFGPQLELAWKNSKALRKHSYSWIDIDECEPVDLLLWIYAPILRPDMEKFYRGKGKRLNKLYPQRICKKLDTWLLRLQHAQIACTDMLRRWQ